MRVHIPDFNINLTANSGQSFRFNERKPRCFEVIAFRRCMLIEDLGDHWFDFSCSEEEFDHIWKGYFDIKRDYTFLETMLPHPDSFISKAYAFAKGLRILCQDPFETVIAFIISQRKSIPAIKRCIEQLAHRFGEAIDAHHNAFPTPEALASAEESELAACGLGYRVKYVKGTSAMIASGEIDLNAISGLCDEQLESELMKLPGIGKKVAACIMLFAYQRMDSFPVDVWIARVIDSEFKEGFPFEQFAGHSGIIQQYLFCYARHLAGRQ
ncbi:MAG: DNA-3-methyladenine glycosylase 2 family protein [Clostridiales bacterium]|nr:DNA-3-methyladenine glycosylase 2 family protein [Clostridiales bacterium]